MDNFFQNAYNEENAVETTVDETSVNAEQVEQQEETTEPVANEQQEQQVEEHTPVGAKVTIEGLGEFTIDELKEMKAGYMRQSDYTKKTQELAKMRKQLEEGNNAEATPVQQPFMQQATNPYEARLIELEQKLADKELDDEITRLKAQYEDFDEVKVLNTAYEKGLTDLELVYKSTREVQPVDIATLEKQIRDKVIQELTANKEGTSTIISSGATPVTQQQPTLTPGELAICEEFGLSAEEYHKYK